MNHGVWIAIPVIGEMAGEVDKFLSLQRETSLLSSVGKIQEEFNGSWMTDKLRKKFKMMR